MILVTGATGLVGSHLVLHLIQKEDRIRALYRSEPKRDQAIKLIKDFLKDEEIGLLNKVQWFKGDFTNIPNLTEALQGITEVYHCAAKISFNPARYKLLRKVNIEGTANIVNLCIVNKVKKFCHVSSIAALGEDHNTSIITEAAEWNPESTNSVYAITKYGAEMEVWRGTQEGLDAVIVNPGIIIGPGFFNGGSGVIFKRIYKGLSYYTPGITGYVGVHDVVKSMYGLMKSDLKNNRYILVAENMSFKDSFSFIANALGKKAPTKKASKNLMTFAMYAEWLLHLVFRSKRTIFKASIKSAFSQSNYSSAKIEKDLNFEFEPIQKSITTTASYFLTEYS
ncbi:NAD-dependent epimerase/dehydratase family protein [Aquimarina brevivitae]|uniref:Nucleoside-diphosphate-sugar epimerase n=1 Tax=Aquimarina brevivitae TaxID=323412 RepID=A0A4Q7PGJ0_9FLAO|nr:NAD-dependent epimerase/dehydratase family protein [Aquimarina brevivitae]RZS99643.1 nucleoside-diphosphate-sugar epimerase [Aquimarina brevivitae]